jgi:hypothetical protein
VVRWCSGGKTGGRCKLGIAVRNAEVVYEGLA